MCFYILIDFMTTVVFQFVYFNSILGLQGVEKDKLRDKMFPEKNCITQIYVQRYTAEDIILFEFHFTF